MLGFLPYILHASITFTTLPANAGVLAEEASTPTNKKAKLSIRLQVDTIALNAASIGTILVERIETACKKILEESGVELHTQKNGTILKVKLGSIEGDSTSYIAKLIVQKNANSLESENAADIQCDLCTESEFIQKIETSVKKIAESLPLPEEESSEAPSVLALKPLPIDHDEQQDQTQSRVPLATSGKLGIAALSLGVVSLGGGIGLQVYGARQSFDVRPASISLMTVGGLASAAGVALIVIDRLRAKANKPGKSAFQPFLTHQGTAGIIWYGTF